MPRYFSSLFSAALCGVISAAMLLGQTTAGLSGAITDASGAIVPGARVTLTSIATGAQRETSANESGRPVLSLLVGMTAAC